MPVIKRKILFVCVHNSARSQMAEAFLNKLGAGQFEGESAGLEPGILNPAVVTVLLERGIDIQGKMTRDVFDLFTQGKTYHAVITVCDQANSEKCPVFPGRVKRLAWSFQDPSLFTGTQGEVLEKTRKLRDEIEKAIIDFIRQAGKMDFWL